MIVVLLTGRERVLEVSGVRYQVSGWFVEENGSQHLANRISGVVFYRHFGFAIGFQLSARNTGANYFLG
jgi:hypothetical protein